MALISLFYFPGVYLPLFWDQNFCTKSPIALGYTRGHFSALVPMEPFTRIDGRRDDVEDVTYLPLIPAQTACPPAADAAPTAAAAAARILLLRRRPAAAAKTMLCGQVGV